MFTLHISHQSVDPRKEEAPTQKARLLLILDKARVKGYWRTLETGPVWVSSHQRRGEAHAKPTGNQLGLFGNAPTPQLTMFGGPPPSEHTTQPRPLQHEPAHAQAKPEPEPARPYRPLTEDAIHNWDTPYIQKQYGELPEDIRQAAQEAMRRHHQKGTDAREEAQALNARFGLTPKPEPAKEPQRQPEAEPGKQPWQMTRAEFRAQENAPKVKAIQDAIRSGKQIMVATQLRGTLLTSPEHIRMTSAGHVQTRERTTWVNLTEDKVDALAAQAGYPVPDVMDKVYHHAEVEQALKDGKPVPPEVLADYPDLTQQEEEPEPEPERPALAFPNDDKRPTKAERDQATAAVEALEQPLREFELHFSGPNAPESRFHGFLSFYTGARPGSVSTHYRGVIQGFRHRGDPHPTRTRASLHHAVAGAAHDMEYTAKKYMALATKRGMRAEDLPEGPLRDIYARYAPDTPSMSKARRPPGTGLVLYLNKARVRGHWRILESGPTYVTGYQRRDQPGHHIAEPAHQMRLFGDEPKPQLVLLRQPPEPVDPPVFTRPPRVQPSPSPLLSFPNDTASPSAEERDAALQIVRAQEEPLRQLEDRWMGPDAPASLRTALQAYRGMRPAAVAIYRQRLANTTDTATRQSLHAVVNFAAKDLQQAGQGYVSLALEHGVTATDVPKGSERDTFQRYAVNNPYIREKRPPVQPEPPTYRSLALSLERASNLPVRDIHMQSAGDVAAIFAHLRGAEREKLMAIHVDAENNVQNVECISVGGLTESIANVREVLKAAVVQNTPGLWLLHNHPSGDPTPSKADDDVTKLVHQYGKRLGITLHGHIVVGETHYAHITPEGGVAQHYPYAPVTGEAEDTVPEITLVQTRLPEPALHGKQIRSSADAASIGKELMHGTAQQSYLLVLDQKQKINAAVPLPTTGTGLARQNALNEALRQSILHNGRNCILVSDVDNAQAFQAFTQAFKDSLKGVPITLLDGVRLLPQGHASMADQGLLKALVLYLNKARRLHYRTRRHGLQISIENRKGSIRRGTDPDGNPWQTKMVHPYGYVRGTIGMDGDHLDCFVGPHPDAPHVYIVTTRKAPEFAEQDEQKCFLGFESGDAAKEAFFQNYDDARHFGNMIEMPVEEFKQKARATMERPGAIQAVG